MTNSVPKKIKTAWRYEQVMCAALMLDKDYFNGRARFYFALCVAVTASSKINKPIKDIAYSADVEYRTARKYLNELVKSGKVIRTGEKNRYQYELFEHYAWHGKEESRNQRVEKRQRKNLERLTSTGRKIKLVEDK